jgi:hypothetical protein
MIELYDHSNFSSSSYQTSFTEFAKSIDSINPDKDYKTGVNLKSNSDSIKYELTNNFIQSLIFSLQVFLNLQSPLLIMKKYQDLMMTYSNHLYHQKNFQLLT